MSRRVTHDIGFRLFPKDDNCVVYAASVERDDDPDHDDDDDDFDGYINYCNMWVPLKYADTFVGEKLMECIAVPPVPANTCVH